MHAVHSQKNVLGADFSDTLVSMDILASVYQKQGRWPEAEPLFMEVKTTTGPLGTPFYMRQATV